jgi:hypothetical protein
MDKIRVCPQDLWSVCYTPGDLAWLANWGSLRYTAAAAYTAIAYVRVSVPPACPATVPLEVRPLNA